MIGIEPAPLEYAHPERFISMEVIASVTCPGCGSPYISTTDEGVLIHHPTQGSSRCRGSGMMPTVERKFISVAKEDLRKLVSSEREYEILVGGLESLSPLFRGNVYKRIRGMDRDELSALLRTLQSQHNL